MADFADPSFHKGPFTVCSHETEWGTICAYFFRGCIGTFTAPWTPMLFQTWHSSAVAFFAVLTWPSQLLFFNDTFGPTHFYHVENQGIGLSARRCFQSSVSVLHHQIHSVCLLRERPNQFNSIPSVFTATLHPQADCHILWWVWPPWHARV